MNKEFLSAIVIAAMTLSIGIAQAEPCKGPCPLKSPAAQGRPMLPPDCKKPPMTPEQMKEKHEAKKAEFYQRMNLSEEQKAQLEKIKAEEKKLLEPIHKKMQKKHEEMKALTNQEIDIRTNSMQKFEAILTPEQAAELNKVKLEMKDKSGFKKDFNKYFYKDPACKCPNCPDCKCGECQCKDCKCTGCIGKDCKKNECGCPKDNCKKDCQCSDCKSKKLKK